MRNYISRSLPMMALAAVYFACLSQYFSYIPIWDSRFFYENFIIDAQENAFDTLRYSGNHNAQLWLLLAGIPNYLFPRNHYAFHFWVGLLSTSGVIAFYLILTELVSEKLSRFERWLITVVFAFHPSLFASQIHVTLDTGLLIFWLWYCYALLKENVVAATILGCFLLFTKEPAMAHMAVVFIFCALRKPPEKRAAWIKRHWVSVAIPFTMMGMFLLYKLLIRKQALFYLGFMQNSSQFIHIWPDLTLINFWLMAFVLNFNWVPSLLMLLLLAGQITKKSHSGPADRRDLFAQLWLFTATAAVVLGVRHWSNVRYIIPLFPAMFWLIAMLLPLIGHQQARIACLFVFISLLGWQNFRTVDPLTNRVFCYTDLGKRRLLSIPTEHTCAYKSRPDMMLTNQLAYNLEFIKIPDLLSKIMKDVHPNNDTVFMVDFLNGKDVLTSWSADNTHLWLDSHYEQTMVNDAPIKPRIRLISTQWLFGLETNGGLLGLPDPLYYIEFPSFYSEDYRRFFSIHYAHHEKKLYDIDGYQMELITYSQKINIH